MNRNRAYWNSHRGQFPYHARQDKSGGTATRPEEVDEAVFGDFLRIPIDNKTFWGFMTAEQRDMFITRFGGIARVEPEETK